MSKCIDDVIKQAQEFGISIEASRTLINEIDKNIQTQKNTTNTENIFSLLNDPLLGIQGLDGYHFIDGHNTKGVALNETGPIETIVTIKDGIRQLYKFQNMQTYLLYRKALFLGDKEAQEQILIGNIKYKQLQEIEKKINKKMSQRNNQKKWEHFIIANSKELIEDPIVYAMNNNDIFLTSVLQLSNKLLTIKNSKNVTPELLQYSLVLNRIKNKKKNYQSNEQVALRTMNQFDPIDDIVIHIYDKSKKTTDKKKNQESKIKEEDSTTVKQIKKLGFKDYNINKYDNKEYLLKASKTIYIVMANQDGTSITKRNDLVRKAISSGANNILLYNPLTRTISKYNIGENRFVEIEENDQAKSFDVLINNSVFISPDNTDIYKAVKQLTTKLGNKINYYYPNVFISKPPKNIKKIAFIQDITSNKKDYTRVSKIKKEIDSAVKTGEEIVLDTRFINDYEVQALQSYLIELIDQNKDISNIILDSKLFSLIYTGSLNINKSAYFYNGDKHVTKLDNLFLQNDLINITKQIDTNSEIPQNQLNKVVEHLGIDSNFIDLRDSKWLDIITINNGDTVTLGNTDKNYVYIVLTGTIQNNNEVIGSNTALLTRKTAISNGETFIAQNDKTIILKIKLTDKLYSKPFLERQTVHNDEIITKKTKYFTDTIQKQIKFINLIDNNYILDEPVAGSTMQDYENALDTTINKLQKQFIEKYNTVDNILNSKLGQFVKDIARRLDDELTGINLFNALKSEIFNSVSVKTKYKKNSVHKKEPIVRLNMDAQVGSHGEVPAIVKQAISFIINNEKDKKKKEARKFNIVKLLSRHKDEGKTFQDFVDALEGLLLKPSKDAKTDEQKKINAERQKTIDIYKKIINPENSFTYKTNQYAANSILNGNKISDTTIIDDTSIMGMLNDGSYITPLKVINTYDAAIAIAKGIQNPYQQASVLHDIEAIWSNKELTYSDMVRNFNGIISTFKEQSFNVDTYKPKYKKSEYSFTMNGTTIEMSPDQMYVTDETIDFLSQNNIDPSDPSTFVMYINGKGGTGKSTTIAHAIKMFENKKLNGKKVKMLGATFTHSAKHVLIDMEKTAGLSSEIRTTTSWLFGNKSFDKDQQFVVNKETGFIEMLGSKSTQGIITRLQQAMESNKYNVIVVDEASMLSKKDFNQLLNVAAKNKVKIIMMGDYHQLSPIETKDAFFDSHINTLKNESVSIYNYNIYGLDVFKNNKDLNEKIKKIKMVNLTTQFRQDVESDMYKIIQSASYDVVNEINKINPSLELEEKQEPINFYKDSNDNMIISKDDSVIQYTKSDVFEQYYNSLTEEEIKNTPYISYMNKTIVNANMRIREILNRKNPNQYSPQETLTTNDNYQILDNIYIKTESEWKEILTNKQEFTIDKIEELESTKEHPVLAGRINISKHKTIKYHYKAGTRLKRITLKIKGTNEAHTLTVPADIIKETLNQYRSGQISKVYKKVFQTYIDKEIYKNHWPLLTNAVPFFYSYAITTYASQGKTFDNIVADLDIYTPDNSKLVRATNTYTILSRAKKQIIFAGNYIDTEKGGLTDSKALGSDIFGMTGKFDDIEALDLDFAEDITLLPDVYSLYLKDDQDSNFKFKEQSPEFTKFQGQILNMFQEAFNNGAKSKIAIKEIEASLSERNLVPTSGSFLMKDNGEFEIRIKHNRYSGLSRKSEIFTHEMVHFMTETALQGNHKLKYIIQKLRQQLVNQGLDYTVFLHDIIESGAKPTTTEIEIAKEKFEYAFGKNASESETLAYLVSNESVYMAVKDKIIDFGLDLEMPDIAEKSTAVKNILSRILSAISRVWAAMAGTNNKKAGDVIVSTMAKLVTLKAELDVKASSNTSSVLTQKINTPLNAIDEKLVPLIKQMDTLINTAIGSKKTGTRIDTAINVLRKIKVIDKIYKTHLIQNIFTHIFKKTDNERWAHIYQTFREAEYQTESNSRHVLDAISEVLNKKFEHVDSGTRQLISKVIFKADLQSIFDVLSIEETEKIARLLTDEEFLKEMIFKKRDDFARAVKSDSIHMKGDNAEAAIMELPERAKALGKYIVTGESNHKNQAINANNLYYLFEDNIYSQSIHTYKPTEADKRAIKALDGLTSLYAIQEISENDKKIIADFINRSNSNKNLLLSIFKQYKSYVKNGLDDISVANYNMIQKGYVEPDRDTGKHMHLIPEDQVEFYESKFGNLHNVGSIGTINGVKYYKMIGRLHKSGFTEGLINIASTQLSSGISVKQLLMDQIAVKKHYKDYDQSKIRDIVEEYLSGIIAEGKHRGIGSINMNLNFDAGVNIIPQYDNRGKIIDYIIMPTVKDEEKHLDIKYDIATSMAETFAKIQHRLSSFDYNKHIINILVDYASKYAPENPDAFVVIKKREKGQEFDYDKHGRWERIPLQTRLYIKEKTGKNAISIPKDMIELITGEKDASLTNLKIGNFNLAHRKKLRSIVAALEDYAKEISAWMKDVIVIKTIDVVITNIISNAIQAYTYAGITPYAFFKQIRAKTKSLDEYRKLTSDLNKAIFEKEGTSGEKAKKLDIEIHSIKKRMEQNEFHELIQDGQFSLIVEDVNIDTAAAKGDIARVIEHNFNRNKYTKAVKPIFDFVAVNKNTRIYKALLKATQYGDIVSRQIIYDKLKKDRRIKGEPLSKQWKQKTLNFLDQLFVNYSYVDNRFLKFASSILFFHFTKYYFRELKALHSVAINSPSKFVFSLIAEAELEHITLTEDNQAVQLTGPESTYKRSFTDAMIIRNPILSSIMLPNRSLDKYYVPFYLDDITDFELFKKIWHK